MLGPLVSSTKEKNHDLSEPGEVNAISRSPIDPELHHAFAHRLYVAEVADRHARKSCLDARSRLPILQVEQPFDERPLARGGLVITELHNDCNL